MVKPKVAPYGTWRSPISANLIAKKSISIQDVIVDPITSTVYHIEGRPSEGGRNALVKTQEGVDVVKKGWNARTGVHEYGGAPAVVYDGIVYFSNFEDGRVYKIVGQGEPIAVTPENKNHRFADLVVHPIQRHFIVAILEDHTNPAPRDVVTTLALIDTTNSTVTSIVSGDDFYSSPTFNSDGKLIAWTQWTHPDMPWEGAEILVASVNFTDTTLDLGKPANVSGDLKPDMEGKISSVQPGWINTDSFLYTTDFSGYQNPWLCVVRNGNRGRVPTRLLAAPLEQDFGQPPWVLGNSCYAPLSETSVVFSSFKDGKNVLHHATLNGGNSHCELQDLRCPYVDIQYLRKLTSNTFVFLGKKVDEPSAIVVGTLDSSLHPTYEVLKDTKGDEEETDKISHDLISVPQSIVLRVPPNNEPLYVIYYPPKNPEYTAPQDEKPPCVVNVHGGPTGHSSLGLSMQKQFFTTRGWAWVDVEYGGSSGYGRKYIERLVGNWGIADVSDCIQSVVQLSSPAFGIIDPRRAVIRGGSAGGFTVLAAMCNESSKDVFAAGTSSYGISNLFKLAEFTHKFESRYLEKLMGGTPDDVGHVYTDRSPLFQAAKIRTPLLILQGSIDAVVPPAQAEDIVKAIRESGGRVEYTLFEGEGHGWRKVENIKAALEKELAFYMDVLGLSTVETKL
ncbi:alpha/beta-hydrolase [Rickenella mellea]|uniref:Alpha/beta-hydrolase n=1 Tax=Rickenella mellea TaxID=50990 RepID=A0A4Y7Q8S2_9AGAM|nr:alpha/beta-hydrolase [Rickenella mellea]